MKKQHIFAEPREQKTESSDNSPEQMRLSPIWSIIALTNKWHAVLFGAQLERLRERLEKTDLKKTFASAQGM